MTGWDKFSREEIIADWDRFDSAKSGITHSSHDGYPLGDSEKPLLDNYRALNETGQQKAADYVEDLTKISEYQKKD